MGATEGPAHHGSSFGPADVVNQTLGGPKAPEQTKVCLVQT